MSANTDYQNISLYIPHIFANFSKEFVAKVFEDLNIGNVKNIDFVSKYGQDGKEYNAAYIHFNEWYDTIAARNFQARVMDSKLEARVVYDEPWYWIVLENKARKYVSGERKPRIDLGTPSISQASALKATVKTTVETTPAPKKYKPSEAIDINKAPVKIEAKKPAATMPTPVKLETEFAAVEVQTEPLAIEDELAWVDELLKEDAEQYAQEMMDDVEALMEEDDKYLIQIDCRYVQALEEENQNVQSLQEQIASLQQQLAVAAAHQWNTESALRTEQVKSQALAEVIQMLKK
jgi:hypothetical protein